MEISRRGAERNHGSTTVVPETALRPGERYHPWTGNTSWDERTESLIACASNVRHSAGPNSRGNGSHDYEVALPLPDVAVLISLLGNEVSATHPQLVHEALKPHIDALIKLLSCASGFAHTPLASGKASAPASS